MHCTALHCTDALPQVTEITGSLPTTGGTVTIKGMYFGRCSPAALANDCGPEYSGICLHRLACGAVFLNGTRLPCSVWDGVNAECAVPAGQGKDIPFVLKSVSGQTSTTLSYNKPTLSADTVIPWFPTTGQTTLTIAGTSFGTEPSVVKVDIKLSFTDSWVPCPVVGPVTHGVLTCISPEGAGEQLDLRVTGPRLFHPRVIECLTRRFATVGGQTAEREGAVSYEPPQIEELQGSPAPLAKPWITVIGENFGVPGSSELDLTIPAAGGGRLSPVVLFRNHTRIVFVAESVPGSVSLDVQLAVQGQTPAAGSVFTFVFQVTLLR